MQTHSPYSIESLHRCGPTQSLSLVSNQQLSVVISHHARFADQSLVLQVVACDLLVQIFQADQEHAVTEPETGGKPIVKTQLRAF